MSGPIPLREERSVPETATRLDAIVMLRLALQTLSHRAMLWVVTLGSGAIWTYTILHPDLLRLITAVAYSLTIMWPFLWHDTRGGE